MVKGIEEKLKPYTSFFLITGHFPYHAPQESFLELELETMAQDSMITVLPLSCGEKQRKVPVNTKVDNALNMDRYRAYKWGKLVRLIYGVMTPELWIELYKNPDLILNTKELIKLTVFLGSSKIFAVKTAELIKSYKQQRLVFYCYWLRYPVFALIKLKKQYPEIKIIARAHNLEFNPAFAQDNYLPFMKTMIEGTDTTAFISQFGYEFVKQQYNVTKHCHVSYLGIKRHEQLAKPSSQGQFNVVSCSFIREVKRIDLIIAGLEQFYKQYPDIEICWTHLGGGDLDEELFKQLHQQAKHRLADQGLSIIFKGFMSNEQIFGYYSNNAVDVFVNVSESEGVPVSIMEAASFGIPVIATDVGGVRELVSPVVGELLPSRFFTMDLCQALYRAYQKKDPVIRRQVKQKLESKFLGCVNYHGFYQQFLADQ